MNERFYALLMVLLILAPMSVVVKSAGTGYLAIKDYLGNVWSYEDIRKIMNYYYTSSSGENKSLADYFRVVVDGQSYGLSDFVVSPLDNFTAVIPLPAGDHYVDIYWFGYHQRQLVHIVENYHYVLNLETAPVVPFPVINDTGYVNTTVGYEFTYDIAPNDGLKILRDDGAFVLFKYNSSIIRVGWSDNLGNHFEDLDIWVNPEFLKPYGSKVYFHIQWPDLVYVYNTSTVPYPFMTNVMNFSTYVIREEIRTNEAYGIQHIAYIEIIYKYERSFDEVESYWRDISNYILRKTVTSYGIVDPLTMTITDIGEFIRILDKAYDFFIMYDVAARYLGAYMIIIDVFFTYSQIIITGHSYFFDPNRVLLEEPLRSPNAFVIKCYKIDRYNRMVYVKQLHNGMQLSFYDMNGYRVFFSNGPGKMVFKSSSRINIPDGTFSSTTVYAKLPGYSYYSFHLDDFKKYSYTAMFSANLVAYYDSRANLSLVIIIGFDDTDKADLFEQRLISNNLGYVRNDNVFEVAGTSVTVPLNITCKSIGLYSDFEKILSLVPDNSSGVIGFRIDGYIEASEKIFVSDITITYMIEPRTDTQVVLFKDSYYMVDDALGIHLLVDIRDNDTYMLGYYLLGNEPPSSYIIRDIYYDPDCGTAHYMYIIVPADIYGKDIIHLDNETISSGDETIYRFYLYVEPGTSSFDNVVLTLFNYNKTSFINLAPEKIQQTLVVPIPSMYGAPVIDYGNVQVLTINLTRPYKLYLYNNETYEWVEVNIEYNDTVYVVKKNDQIIETLPNGSTTDNLYKLVYMDTDTSYTCFLKNNNGTLEIVAVDVEWSISQEDLNKILEQIQLQKTYNEWLTQWNQTTSSDTSNPSIAIVTNKYKWLLLSGSLFIIIILIILLSSAGRRNIRIR